MKGCRFLFRLTSSAALKSERGHQDIQKERSPKGFLSLPALFFNAFDTSNPAEYSLYNEECINTAHGRAVQTHSSYVIA